MPDLGANRRIGLVIATLSASQPLGGFERRPAKRDKRALAARLTRDPLPLSSGRSVTPPPPTAARPLASPWRGDVTEIHKNWSRPMRMAKADEPFYSRA